MVKIFRILLHSVFEDEFNQVAGTTGAPALCIACNCNSCSTSGKMVEALLSTYDWGVLCARISKNAPRRFCHYMS